MLIQCCICGFKETKIAVVIQNEEGGEEEYCIDCFDLEYPDMGMALAEQEFLDD